MLTCFCCQSRIWSMFDESIIPQRWSKRHFLRSLKITQIPSQLTSQTRPICQKQLSQQQKFKRAFSVAQKLASCAAEETGSNFEVRLNQLELLLSAWEKRPVCCTRNNSMINVHRFVSLCLISSNVRNRHKCLTVMLPLTSHNKQNRPLLQQFRYLTFSPHRTVSLISINTLFRHLSPDVSFDPLHFHEACK